nr:ParA family protein [Enterococcus innesii]
MFKIILSEVFLVVKVFSTVIEKGGVGKTTVTYNGGERLASLNKRVLLVDMDKKPSLTARYDIDESYYNDGTLKREHTVAKFFEDGGSDPVPINVKPNIDLIAGYPQLSELKKDVEEGMQRMYLLRWFYANLDELEKKYDYIWIDNHNDLSIFVDNTIAISDLVVIPIDVDLDSMNRLSEVDSHIERLKKIMVEPISKKSYVNAASVKIGNMLDYNTSDSHSFKKAFEELSKSDPSYLGCFYRRTAFKAAKSQNKPLVEIEREASKNDKGLQKFFVDTWAIYDKIFETADNI